MRFSNFKTSDGYCSMVIENGVFKSFSNDLDPTGIDLEGAFLVPAFRDGHAHPLFAGRENQGPQVSDAKSISEILEIVSEFASTSTEAWLVGGAYDRSLAHSPLAKTLDEACSERPVVLHASDHHTVWANTAALESAGLFDEIPEFNVGSVDVDAHGNPTGVLREAEAIDYLMSFRPQRSMEQELDALMWAQQQLISNGIVEVVDAWIKPWEAEVYLEAARRNLLKISFQLLFLLSPDSWREDLARTIEFGVRIKSQGNPNLNLNGAKFFADGVFGSATASVLEPYLTEELNPTGEPVWEFSELVAAASSADRENLEIHIHAIGDAGVRLALDAIEHVISKNPECVRRPVIAHTELVDQTDYPRFAKLGVIANFEPLWARKDGMLLSCQHRLGAKRLDRMYPMRQLWDAGAIISFGSDWPVSSPSPILGLFTAVTRSVPGGESWTPESALSITESLKAYSQNVSLQFRDDAVGLTKGSMADFIVLSANPVSQPPESLHSIKVLKTIRSGVVISQ